MALFLSGEQNFSSVYIVLFYYVVLRPLLAQQQTGANVWTPSLSDSSSLTPPVITYQCKNFRLRYSNGLDQSAKRIHTRISSKARVTTNDRSKGRPARRDEIDASFGLIVAN